MNMTLATPIRALAASTVHQRHILALVLLLGCFAPLLWLAQYNYPAGDDYLAFFQAHNLGTLGATRWWYRYWTGRYSSFLLQSLFPDHGAWLIAYRVIPVILLLAGLGSLVSFVRTLFSPGLSSRQQFTLAACAYIFVVSLTPEMATAFYWLPSNVQYVGAVFITLLLLALFMSLARRHHPLMRGLYWLAAVFLMAILGGLNEISIVLFVAILIFINVWHGLRYGTISPRGLAFLACSILFALIAWLAPGNSIRAEYVVKVGSSLTVLTTAIRFTFRLWLDLLTATPLALVSVLYLIFLASRRERLSTLFEILAGVRWPWIFLLLPITFIVVAFAFFNAAGVGPAPDRVRNVFVYSFVLSWFFLLTVVFVDLSRAGYRLPVEKGVFRFFGFVAGVVVLAFVATGFQLTGLRGQAGPAAGRADGPPWTTIKTASVYANAYLDVLSGRATAYAAQTRETTRLFRAADGECVEFSPLVQSPETIVIRFVKYPWRWCPKEYLRRFHSRHNTAHAHDERR